MRMGSSPILQFARGLGKLPAAFAAIIVCERILVNKLFRARYSFGSAGHRQGLNNARIAVKLGEILEMTRADDIHLLAGFAISYKYLRVRHEVVISQRTHGNKRKKNKADHPSCGNRSLGLMIRHLSVYEHLVMGAWREDYHKEEGLHRGRPRRRKLSYARR